MANWLHVQFYLVHIHLTNCLANALGQDIVSRGLRRLLFRALGVRIGRASVIDGGGYIYGNQLVIGRRCFINRSCYFDLTDMVTIGDDVEIGHGVTFITATHRVGPRSRRAGQVTGQPIVVGNGAWVGANATLLPGVTIGSGSIVAAGALVAEDVAENVVVAGVPARHVRELISNEAHV